MIGYELMILSVVVGVALVGISYLVGGIKKMMKVTITLTNMPN
jgi:vacuolar-type H+-ATPase subunit I/STV1